MFARCSLLLMLWLGTALSQTPQDDLFQLFKPAPAQRFYIDLDCAEGRYSQWRKDDLGGMNALRASVVIRHASTHIKWSPAFSLYFGTNNSKDNTEAGVQIWSPDHRAPFRIRIVHYDRGIKVSEEVLSKVLDADEKLEIEMFLAGPNTVVVNIRGSEIRKITVPWKPASIKVLASTGEMIVDPLELGTMGQ